MTPHPANLSLPQYSGSEAEATFYYSGLSSSPRLVYRTGSVPWTEPTGPEAYRDLLDSAGVRWTTIDVVRFLKVGEGEIVGPVVLWTDMFPESFSGKDAHTAAYKCLDRLKGFGINDVEVELRESAGPSLIEPVSDLGPTVDVCGHLTPALTGLGSDGEFECSTRTLHRCPGQTSR